MVIEHNY